MADLEKLPAYGKNGVVHVVIETPKGSGVKLAYEPQLGTFSIARPLALGVVYPYDWGFVPSTLADDGDPLDAMVLYDGSTFPGFLLRCRPLGVVRVAEKKKRNDRVILVPVDYPRCDHLKDVVDLPKRTRQELEEFFEIAVTFTGKSLKKLGWGGAAEAAKVIRNAVKRAKLP